VIGPIAFKNTLIAFKNTSIAFKNTLIAFKSTLIAFQNTPNISDHYDVIYYNCFFGSHWGE